MKTKVKEPDMSASAQEPTGLNLTGLAAEVHAANLLAGWWDGCETLQDKVDLHGTKMMLVVSEWAEAMEGDRKDLMDDHLPHHRMFDVELADVFIRLLDLAGAYGMELRYTKETLAANTNFLRNRPAPSQLYVCVRSMLKDDDVGGQVYVGLSAVISICEAHGIPLYDIAKEKREYNAKRADHKAANRAAAGGKAY